MPKNFEGGIIYKPLSENDNNYVKEKQSYPINPQTYYPETNESELSD